MRQQQKKGIKERRFAENCGAKKKRELKKDHLKVALSIINRQSGSINKSISVSEESKRKIGALLPHLQRGTSNFFLRMIMFFVVAIETINFKKDPYLFNKYHRTKHGKYL